MPGSDVATAAAAAAWRPQGSPVELPAERRLAVLAWLIEDRHLPADRPTAAAGLAAGAAPLHLAVLQAARAEAGASTTIALLRALAHSGCWDRNAR